MHNVIIEMVSPGFQCRQQLEWQIVVLCCILKCSVKVEGSKPTGQ